MHRVDDIEFDIVRKKGLKYTYIHIKDGRVEVRANRVLEDREIYNLVSSKKEWIKKSLKNSLIQNDIEHASKEQACKLIMPLVEKWSEIMNLKPTFVGFRNNKSRWGSCSGKDRINFNTKLVNMPLEFVEYVVVHELAHIKHKNHSKEFWREVERYLPDFKERKELSKDPTAQK